MTAELSLPLLIGLIAVALAFDFLNGLHDTANSIATLVSTRMLRPRVRPKRASRIAPVLALARARVRSPTKAWAPAKPISA